MSITLAGPATLRTDTPALAGDPAWVGEAPPAVASHSTAVSLFADVLCAIGCVSDRGDAVGQTESPALPLPVASAMPRVAEAEPAVADQADAALPDADRSGATSTATDPSLADLPLTGLAMAASLPPATTPARPLGATIPRVADGTATPSREPVRAAATGPSAATLTPVAVASDPRRTADDIASPAVSGTAAHAGGVVSTIPGHGAATHGDDDGVLRLASGSTASPQWRSALQEALGDRLQLQLNRRSEQAVIRLDPPALGRIEIAIRHEGGTLQVHLSASNGEVLRQLAHIGDSLRQDLAHRHYSDVQVVVGEAPRDAEGRQRQPQRQAQEEEVPHRALAEADDGLHASAFALAPDKD